MYLYFDSNLQVSKMLISSKKINIANIKTKSTTTNDYVWLQYISVRNRKNIATEFDLSLLIISVLFCPRASFPQGLSSSNERN